MPVAIVWQANAISNYPEMGKVGFMFLATRRATTLVELLIVLTIICLLFIVAFPLYRRVAGQRELSAYTAHVQSILEQGKNMSLASPPESEALSYCFEVVPNEKVLRLVGEKMQPISPDRCGDGEVVLQEKIKDKFFIGCKSCAVSFKVENNIYAQVKEVEPITFVVGRSGVNKKNHIVLDKNGFVYAKISQ